MSVEVINIEGGVEMKRNYNKMFNENQKVTDEVNDGKVDDELIETEKINNIPNEPKTYTVITKGKLNVRRHPSAGMQSEMLCQLRPGDKVQVESIEDDWAHIYTTSGIEGYVMANLIKED